MRREAERTNGGESRRNERVELRADSFRGPRKAKPSSVPAPILRGILEPETPQRMPPSQAIFAAPAIAAPAAGGSAA